MGFVRPETTYDLKFEGPEYAGFEVSVRSIPLGDFLVISNFQVGKTNPKELAALFKTFGESLVSWNLEEKDGTPIPPTLAAVNTLQINFVLAIVTPWVEAMSGVAAPLESGSTSGANALEASIPTETLSPNPPN